MGAEELSRDFELLGKFWWGAHLGFQDVRESGRDAAETLAL